MCACSLLVPSSQLAVNLSVSTTHLVLFSSYNLHPVPLFPLAPCPSSHPSALPWAMSSTRDQCYHESPGDFPIHFLLYFILFSVQIQTSYSNPARASSEISPRDWVDWSAAALTSSLLALPLRTSRVFR